MTLHHCFCTCQMVILAAQTGDVHTEAETVLDTALKAQT